MSEKRFYLGNNDTTICDRSQGGSDGFNMLTKFEVVDLLNELVKDNEELGISIKLFEDDIATKDKKIDEQQATIRKLQDLCGESDGENAKLRIENKKLKEEIKLLKPVNIEQYEQIVQLQEENEQLRQQHQRLYNYFRDYLEDEMSAENFGEMWDNVKEDERWNDE